MSEFRIEIDTMGEVCVPANAHYGAQTQRAVENFPISGLRFPRRLIRVLGLVKATAAEVNQKLGLIKDGFANAIVTAATEVADGEWERIAGVTTAARNNDASSKRKTTFVEIHDELRLTSSVHQQYDALGTERR